MYGTRYTGGLRYVFPLSSGSTYLTSHLFTRVIVGSDGRFYV